MEGGDARSFDLEKSLDSTTSEFDGLKLDSREPTPSDRGLARSQKQEENILKEIKKTEALGSNTLDLSNRGLLQIPEEILKLQNLEYLYLEGNELSFLPDDFFDCLPNLKWLDLRRNYLSRLPSVYIGRHRNLKNLLLEGNSLMSLPLELGQVKTLTGLNITDNPLEFPPKDIIEKGTQEILKFLNEMLLAKLSAKHSGDYEDDILNYDEAGSDQSDDDWMAEYENNRCNLYSQDNIHTQHGRNDLVGPVPQSAELHRPISYTDRKQQHVERLKKAGALGTFERKKQEKNLVKNWKVNRYPEPPAADFVDIRMAEERKMAKVKELKERQDAILQRRRDEQLLKDWRDESKKLQQKKYFQQQIGALDYEDPVNNAPFAVADDHIRIMTNEERIKSDVKSAHEKIRRPISPGTKQRIEAEKTARIKELEKRIKDHTNVMLERRKQPKGSPQQEMDAAKKELAIVKYLQKDLMKRYQELKTWTSGVFMTSQGDYKQYKS